MFTIIPCFYTFNAYIFHAASIKKDIWASGSANEEYLKALKALLSNFPRLRVTEPATLCMECC
jgi:hypothetical protein